MPAAIKKSSGLETFTAFPVGAPKFLSALAKNNNREWFQPRKAEFDELLHTPLVQFAGLINKMLEKDAREYAYLDPAKALNRIYRDVRFSADKTPYQTHVSCLFPHQKLGKKTGAALYFALSATDITIAAGLYFGETRELQAVREYLAEHYGKFRTILKTKALKDTFGDLKGESLQKTPKQFGAEHAAADLLKQKQWLLMATWPAKQVASEQFADEALRAFRLLIPFVRFLNAPLEALAAQNQDPLV